MERIKINSNEISYAKKKMRFIIKSFVGPRQYSKQMQIAVEYPFFSFNNKQSDKYIKGS